eukprot:m.200442 g.200442  ORF g.200442 m.200442 type:complete len:92 (+) comp10663_c0_seq1:551-826(+)
MGHRERHMSHLQIQAGKRRLALGAHRLSQASRLRILSLIGYVSSETVFFNTDFAGRPCEPPVAELPTCALTPLSLPPKKFSSSACSTSWPQ